MQRGYTLAEAAAVLVLLTIGVASLAPAARRYRDAARVVGAREAVTGLIASARAAAVGVGGATVEIDVATRLVRASLGDSLLAEIELEGVEIVLGGGRSSSSLEFDALGLGRASSETILFRRGGYEAAVVVSSYGRVRRR